MQEYGSTGSLRMASYTIMHAVSMYAVTFHFTGRRQTVVQILAKIPHSLILHYACGSMCVVNCFAIKK